MALETRDVYRDYLNTNWSIGQSRHKRLDWGGIMLTFGDRWCRPYSGEVAVKTLEIQRYPTRFRLEISRDFPGRSESAPGVPLMKLDVGVSREEVLNDVVND